MGYLCGLVGAERDDRTDEDAAAFRPNRRPILLAVVVNVVVAALFLGAPYARGRLRARQARERFGHFTACLLNASPAPNPGLGLPIGHEDRYADLVMSGDRRWPERCYGALAAVGPEPVMFLLPGAKQAEQDARAGVALVRRELDVLARTRRAGVGPIPVRPLRALNRLQAALSALEEAAGEPDTGRENSAIRLTGVTRVAAPERIPFGATLDAPAVWRTRGDGLEAIGIDLRTVAWVRVGAGHVSPVRFARPGLVRGAVLAGDRAWIVWATSATRCAGDPTGCARRATGVAPLPDNATRAPEPTWLGGHPAGRVDRVLAIEPPDLVDLVAVNGPPAPVEEGAEPVPAPAEPAQPAGAAEVRQFRLGAQDGPAAREAIARWALEGFADGDAVAVVAGRPTRAAWTVRLAGGGVAARARALDVPDSPVVDLGATPGAVPWIATCAAGAVAWVAFGSELASRVARVDADGPLVTAETALVAPAGPIDDNRPLSDAVRLLCDATGATLVTRAEGSHAVSVSVCDAAARCSSPREVARGVRGFDAARVDGTTIVAWAGGPADTTTRVRRVDERGVPVGAAAAPAACWSEGSGFCGGPMLVGGNARVLLAAHDGTDLMVLESVDRGAHWRRLTGLR